MLAILVVGILIATARSVWGLHVSVFVAGSSAHYAQVGDSVIVFKCVVQPVPTNAVYGWFKDGTLVQPSFRQQGTDMPSLKITDLTTSDSGSYECWVTLDTGEKKRSAGKATLRVFDPPQITYHGNVLVRETRPATLECRGTDYDRILWYDKTGSPLTFDRRFEMPPDSSKGEKIRLKNASLSDAGVYTCQAKSTSGGQTEKSLKLTVGIEPNIAFHPVDQVIQAGFRAEFRCNVTGIPTPSITWQKGQLPGEKINTKSLNYVIRSNGRSSVLIIENVEKLDEEYYFCVATNLYDVVNSRRAQLIVGSPPTVPPPGSQPIEIVARKAIAYGSNATIACRASGLLNPVVSWTKDDQSIDGQGADEYYQEETGELVIQDVVFQDAGKYRCTIFIRGLPVVHQTVHVTVKGPPNPPTLARAKYTEGKGSIQWTPPAFDGNSIIIGYEIYLKQSEKNGVISLDDLSWTFKKVVGVENNTAVIDLSGYLVTSRVYTFHFAVKVTNAYGSSKLSNSGVLIFFHEKIVPIGPNLTVEFSELPAPNSGIKLIKVLVPIVVSLLSVIVFLLVLLLLFHRRTTKKIPVTRKNVCVKSGSHVLSLTNTPSITLV